MAVEVEIRPLREGDIASLLAGMRRADREEVEAASGDVEGSLVDGVCESNWVLAGTVDGELACIFGLVPLNGLLGRRGVPWMLGTDLLDKHPGALMKRCRGYVALMLRTYPHLLNFVDARNTRSIRWLKRLGFTLHPAAPYGAQQRPFHLFELKV